MNVANQQILSWGYQIPVYFPPSMPLPKPGLSLLQDEDKLYFVHTETNDRLMAVSAQSLGTTWVLVTFFFGISILSGGIAYLVATTFLRKHFVPQGSGPTSISQALTTGESESVEFKRSISFQKGTSLDQALQSIVAFLNSGNGTLFVGIQDDHEIVGVPVTTAQDKDKFSQSVYHAARQRIRPSPMIKVDFVVTSEKTICRIFVPRGEEPLYYLDGSIFVRYGPTDIKAQPEIVKKILLEYAY